MKRKHLYAAMLALGMAGPASAANITIGFGGTVTNDPYAVGWSNFTGQFSYDSGWSDANPAAHTGTYQGSGPSFGISVDFGAGNGYDLYGSLFTVSILNDYFGLGDGLLALGDDGAGTSIELNLYDSLAALFGSDLLPTEAPNLNAFDWRSFALFSPDLEIGGSVDSLFCISGCFAANPGGGKPGNGGGTSVPEPGALWLVSLGFWVLGHISRRQPELLKFA